MATLGLAFLAGLLTILSPCTLPVVPALVGAAFGPARSARIAGLVVGFAGTFLLTTIVLASVLAQAGLTLAPARIVAAVVLAAAGLALLIARLGDLVESAAAPFAAVASRLVPIRFGTGPWRSGTTGLVIGSLLGLVWAPCVGPLMAGAIASAVVAGPTVGALVIAMGYLTGMAVALGAVFLAASSVRRAGAPASLRLRSATGAGMVMVGALVVSGLDVRLGVGWLIQPDELAQPAAAYAADPRSAAEETVGVELRDNGPAPELAGITAWINSDPTTLAQLRGRVVLVHFWTFGCSNCQAVQPYVKAWFEKYGGPDFTVLGVHTPELSFERDLASVRTAVAGADVRFPVAFDPDFATWRAYGNHYWPAFYFVDRQGRIRYVHFGEGEYAESEAVIGELIAAPA